MRLYISPNCRHQGSSLIELLIASCLSFGVLLAAISTLQSANSSFIWLEQAATLQDNGSYALNLIAQAIRQSTYIDYTQSIDERYLIPEDGAVWGADARSVKSGDFSKAVLDQHAVNGSDVLVIRFSGADVMANTSVVNCAGFTVNRTNQTEVDRGWSIFYVALNSFGQPELRCKYRGNTEWESQAIVSGVESFQILYGIDSNGDGLANQYLNAAGISKLDLNKNQTDSPWKEVVAIRVSLLLHAPSKKINKKEVADKYDLFGSAYAQTYSDEDEGTSIVLNALPAESRGWYRHVVQSIIYLRTADKPT